YASSSTPSASIAWCTARTGRTTWRSTGPSHGSRAWRASRKRRRKRSSGRTSKRCWAFDGTHRRSLMKIVDAIAEILKREGVTFLSAYPTTSVIDATAAVGIRSVLCRQERVGVGIDDWFASIMLGMMHDVLDLQDDID